MDKQPSTSRVQKFRENLTDEQRQSQQEIDRRRKSASRKTEAAKKKKPKSHAEILSEARRRETEEQTNQRRRSERIRANTNRAAETVSIRRQRLQQDAERHHQERLCLPVQSGEEVQEFYCGPMDNTCTVHYCKAKYFAGEATLRDKVFTRCCQRGDIKLPEIQTSPLFEALLSGNHQHSKNFKENIRSFNSALSFASVGATIATPPGHGPYCFKIHGQIYHRAGTLHPTNGQLRRYAQLYILDPEEAAKQRSAILENNGCNPQLMIELSNYMALNNPHAKASKMLYEVEQEAMRDAELNNVPMPNITMAITKNRTEQSGNRGRYNLQTSNEVAIVFEDVDGEPPLERDLIIHLRSSDMHQRNMERISVLHPGLESMTYPVLFPFGDNGWSETLRHVQKTGTRVSQMEYYSYRFSIRDGFNPYLQGGRLTQQLYVDAYVKMEANRLNYIRMNQDKLRTEMYSALADHLNCDASSLPGRAVILPSSFMGSPRNMQQNYQDAMAIVRKYGKPDFFITMTCNPKWREINENLLPHQEASDRPDLVARVFSLKLKELMKDLDKGVLGKPLARIYVIEFQKRGLPHAHILQINQNGSKPNSLEIVDNLVKAEIPDQQTNQRLFELVTKHMVHGPCGTVKPDSLCMDDGKCTKDFPKQYCEETKLDVGGYPKYQRRNNGVTTTKKGNSINNQWIVPYNPTLLLKFNCHINVEVCVTVKSVKYLFKYVYKGHDSANIQMGVQLPDQHNEVKTFLDSRYVSPPEAAWRIFSFKMHDQTHTVSRLQVHLPNRQAVYFQPDQIQQAVDLAAVKDTTLTAYFKLNVTDSEAHEYFYYEIPEHYVYKDRNAVENRIRKRNQQPTLPSDWHWAKRQRGGEKVIGRMYTVSIAADKERYCLRQLLLRLKGATSFEDLRTVNGVVHEKFEDAAEALGLLESPAVWEETMAEAVLIQMPKQVREVFATICVLTFVTTSCIRALFHQYKEDLCQDYTYQNRHPPNCVHCINLALLDLQSFFEANNKTCEEFGLPVPTNPTIISENHITENKVTAAEMYCSLNDEQLVAFEKVYNAVASDSQIPKCYFLDGPGGSGKTFVYETLIHTLIGEKKNVLAVASTGVAANLLTRGRTAHSQFGIPVPLTESSVSNIKPNSKAAEEIRQTKLII